MCVLVAFCRGGISWFWRLKSEKTVWGDTGGNFEEKTCRTTKENQGKTNNKSEKQRMREDMNTLKEEVIGNKRMLSSIYDFFMGSNKKQKVRR